MRSTPRRRSNPTRAFVVAALLAAGIHAPAAQAAGPPSLQQFRTWVSGPVALLMLPEELVQAARIDDVDEGKAFIEGFWMRRDPTPSTAANEFRTDFRERLAFVDREFSEGAGVNGWMTVRGRVYLLLGRPHATFTTPREFLVNGARRSLRVWRYLDQCGENVADFAFVATASGTRLARSRQNSSQALTQERCLQQQRVELVQTVPIELAARPSGQAEPLPVQVALSTNGRGIMARLSLALQDLRGEPQGDRILYRFHITAGPAAAAGGATDLGDELEISLGAEQFRTWSDQSLHLAVWLPTDRPWIRVTEVPTGRSAQVAMRATGPGDVEAIGLKLGVAALLQGRGVAVAYFPTCPVRHPRVEALLVSAGDPGALVVEPLPGGELALAAPPRGPER